MTTTQMTPFAKKALLPARSVPVCGGCGKTMAYVAAHIWKCPSCGQQQHGRIYFKGDPEYWRIVDGAACGLQKGATMRPDKTSALAERLAKLRASQNKKEDSVATITAAIPAPFTVTYVDQIPPDDHGRVFGCGRWIRLRQQLRIADLSGGKKARIGTEMGKPDRLRAAAAARAVFRQRGIRVGIATRIEQGFVVLYIEEAKERNMA